MTFVKKTWKDRIAEFANRRTLTKSDNTTEVVTVARNEGTITQEGDAFSAANMNNLETRIKDEFYAINSKLANGNITFSVVNNIPYVKVGADPARPFSGNAQKKDIVSGVTTYTFDRDVVGYSIRAVTGNTVYIDNYLNGEHLFGWFNKSNTSDRYIGTANNGYGIISGKTIIIITDITPTSGYILAYFE